MYTKFTRGKEDLRSVQTTGHSRFWQSGRPFHRFIHQCQQVGFASRQSECLAGYAECSQHTCPSPEGQRTQAAFALQPLPTAVFTAVRQGGEDSSLCGIGAKQPTI